MLYEVASSLLDGGLWTTHLSYLLCQLKQEFHEYSVSEPWVLLCHYDWIFCMKLHLEKSRGLEALYPYVVRDTLCCQVTIVSHEVERSIPEGTCPAFS